MKCHVKGCKRETSTRCWNCWVPVCYEHSNEAQPRFTGKSEQMCYLCRLKVNLLTMHRKGLKLNEILKNCLWSLDNRYPRSIVAINEPVYSFQSSWSNACSPISMFELLHVHAPQVLDAPACLVINAQESAIYLLEESQEIPAFRISCGRRVPLQRENRRLLLSI